MPVWTVKRCNIGMRFAGCTILGGLAGRRQRDANISIACASKLEPEKSGGQNGPERRARDAFAVDPSVLVTADGGACPAGGLRFYRRVVRARAASRAGRPSSLGDD